MRSTEEPDSNELLEEARRATSTEAYLKNLPPVDLSLSSYLNQLLQEKQLTRAQVFKAAGIGNTFGYYIFKGERGCSRDAAISLAFGLGLNLQETQRLLSRAGASRLWAKRPRDVVIIRAIDAGYSRAQCDDELFRLGFSVLMDD